MSVIDVANGFRGSKGTTTLSVRDTQELQEIVNLTGRTIEVDRMRSGGCIVNCEDLCNVVFGDGENDEDAVLPDPTLLNNQASDVVAKMALTPAPVKRSRKLRDTRASGPQPKSLRRNAFMGPTDQPGSPGSGGTFSEHPNKAQPSGDTNPIGPRSNPQSLAAQIPGLEVDPSGQAFGAIDPQEEQREGRSDRRSSLGDPSSPDFEKEHPPLPGNDPKTLETEAEKQGSTSPGQPVKSAGAGSTGDTSPKEGQRNQPPAQQGKKK